jgi:hypothetical protein
MRKKLASCVLVGVALAVGAGSALAGENWIGTWKLNAAKSKPGSNAISVQTLKFEATPEGVKLTSEGTDPEGKPVMAGYTTKYDGKDVPWSGNPVADMASAKKIDENTYENLWKKGGKTLVTAKVSVSADGKTLTVTQSGTDAQGKPVSSLAVYDKQ